jgi:hypothetical protein
LVFRLGGPHNPGMTGTTPASTRVGPTMRDLLWPTVLALRAREGSTSAREGSERAAGLLAAPGTVATSQWTTARSVLKAMGLATNPVRGRWLLTPAGQAATKESVAARYKEHLDRTGGWQHWRPTITTVGEGLYWSYANLARADYAVAHGLVDYDATAARIRISLYQGLVSGEKNPRSVYFDERARLVAAPGCAYCGDDGSLSLDHLVPRAVGGSDSGDNLVYACGSCNSSKGARDLLDWCATRGVFPPLLVLRRYLKALIAYCRAEDHLAVPWAERVAIAAPFRLDLVPLTYPRPVDLRM